MKSSIAGKSAGLAVCLAALLLVAGCSGAPARNDGIGVPGSETPAPADSTGEAGQVPAGEKAAGEKAQGGTAEPGDESGAAPEGTGGTLSEEDYREFAGIGKAVTEARKLFVDYFTKKEKGTVDTTVLDRAIMLYEQLVPRAEALVDKLENNREIEQLYMEVVHDLMTLKDEK